MMRLLMSILAVVASSGLAACDRSSGRAGKPATAAPALLDATGGEGSLTCSVFADSYQIYVYDSRAEPIFIREWSNQSIGDKLVVKPGAFAFCPMREMDVPVTVRVRPTPPTDDPAEWDHVAEGWLDLPSGRLLVMGPVDTPAARVELRAGGYRFRVSGRGFATIDAAGVHGSDQYEVCLWPGEQAAPRVIKRWTDAAPASAPVDEP